MKFNYRRTIAGAVGLLFVFIAGHLLFITLDGLSDEINRPDYIIVFGNKVHPDGRVSERLALRLRRTLLLRRKFPNAKIIVSGGLGNEGQDEAKVMAAWLTRRGVPGYQLRVDSRGNNTFATGFNARAVLRGEKVSVAETPVLLVSHYYHVTRARLAFKKFGFRNIGTVHVIRTERREPWSLARELIGYYYYLMRSYPK